MHLSELCEAKGVILVALHPNCTHMLQPADVSVFAPLKKGWQAHVREWKFNNNYHQVVKSDFAPILQEVFKKKATPIVIQNGFKKCGLYPFDADAIDYSKCLKTRTNPGNNQPQNTSDGESQLCEDRVLAIIESKIDSETLAAFKNSGPLWEGTEKAHDLFLCLEQFFLSQAGSQIGLDSGNSRRCWCRQNVQSHRNSSFVSHCTDPRRKIYSRSAFF